MPHLGLLLRKQQVTHLDLFFYDQVLFHLGQPVLGICLGLQLFCRHSAEGDTPCLGIFDVEVKRFTGDLKIPHMGWNTLSRLRGPLFEGIQDGDFVYFVHSFYAQCHPDTAAEAVYGVPFSAALQRDNFFAVQFHPEKSGSVGQQILKNFLKL